MQYIHLHTLSCNNIVIQGIQSYNAFLYGAYFKFLQKITWTLNFLPPLSAKTYFPSNYWHQPQRGPQTSHLRSMAEISALQCRYCLGKLTLKPPVKQTHWVLSSEFYYESHKGILKNEEKINRRLLIWHQRSESFLVI